MSQSLKFSALQWNVNFVASIQNDIIYILSRSYPGTYAVFCMFDCLILVFILLFIKLWDLNNYHVVHFNVGSYTMKDNDDKNSFLETFSDSCKQ